MSRELSELEKKSAHRFQMLAEAAFEGIAFSRKGVLIDCNEQFLKLSGFGKDELVGRTVSDLISVDSREHVVVNVKIALESCIEYGLRCKDGTHKTIEAHGRTIDQNGEAIHVTAVRDITERKARECDLLLRSEARFQLLFEHTLDGIFLETPEGKILHANRSAQRMFGYTEEEFQRSGRSLVFDLSDARLEDALVTAKTTGRFMGQVTLVRKNGEKFEVEISYQEFMDASGRTLASTILRDITQRVLAQKKLVESETRFKALAEQSLVGIYIISADSMVYANPTAAGYFGYRPDEIVLKRQIDLVAKKDWNRVADYIQKCLSGELADIHFEFTGWRKDQTEVNLGVHGSLIEFNGAKVVMGVMQDVTQKMRADQTIKEHVERIERMVLGTISAISEMVDLRDPYTAGHEERVGKIAAAIANEMGLDDNVKLGLTIAGAVHDVGKIAVPAEILTRPRRLTEAEFVLVKEHAEQGYQILKRIDSPWPLADVAKQHHERMDGSGYPDGLKGDEILLEARIIAVADVIESMTSHRPYRAGLGIEAAQNEIERNSGTLYDPNVVKACLHLLNATGYQIPISDSG